jgi:hypothetical protein
VPSPGSWSLLLRFGETYGGFLTNVIVRRGGARPLESRRRWRQKRKRPPRQIRGARPVVTVGYNVSCNAELNVGRRSADGTTDGATDALQVDVPTHDEHGVRNCTHLSRITHFVLVCPAEVDHTGGNRLPRPAIPAAGLFTCVKNYPCLTQLSAVSAGASVASCDGRC